MNTTAISLQSVSEQLPRRKTARHQGRTADAATLNEVRRTLGELPLRRDLLIEHLHALNDRFGQLRTDHMAALAQLLKLAQVEVFEVASFYHHFDVVRENEEGRFQSPPRLTVRVCNGLSCELAGAQALLAKLPALLGGEVRVVEAPCVGRCEQAPVAVVHQRAVPEADADAVQALVKADRRHDDLPAAVDLTAYLAQGGYRLLRDCQAGVRDVEAVIKAMEDSGLRGLGGAGFPAGRKWRIVRAEAAPRLMAVNIDEGEPGTFKDRHYLERDPHRFLEGLLVAAWAVGIAKVYVYLRDEYHGCRALLERELAALRANPPAGGLPEIELRRGAGAYICGEESAMIESIEGKRGMPRLRPPYVAQVGLFGRPTLEHNFETLFWVRDIVERGPQWFAANGRHGRQGLRSFSVSGRVREPGVKLAPAGITLRELVDEYCGGLPEGHELYGYLPGGASGGILPASMADIPLDFDTLQPHGCFIGSAAVVVLTRSATHVDRAVDAARNLMRFFEDESCGQCTPCRAGTAKTRALIERESWDIVLLAELSQVMRDASICGLGQAAPNPVDCVVRYFPHELERS
ncbi:NADH-ubiquinone oxidoreductase-F iron-sulfur binding region domain-containing protein [uncultured Piscinibacter sp.]|uniref:NADH-ubiquinone oxidoreductase-F iron-sulfur binding region domain-containing protein n=1 Tax=uncultured Piscinibacter sp. TaxID=1131835 RepID=UPI00261E8EE6|nr:NADH-ubiquinone oxidoreductase-F iron-sulfur binding region domain-containing protein [uncultured Piscinibacter sp.]